MRPGSNRFSAPKGNRLLVGQRQDGRGSRTRFSQAGSVLFEILHFALMLFGLLKG